MKYVIVETDNRNRGDEAVMSVIGTYATEAEAMMVNAELRAGLVGLSEKYASHEDNPVDYTVFAVESVVLVAS